MASSDDEAHVGEKRSASGARAAGLRRAAGGRHYNWSFTILKHPRLWYAEFKENDMPIHCTYIVYQMEESPTTSREHIQGYIEFSNKKSLNQVKQALESTHAHLEAARGTPHQNRAYCTKDETRVRGFDPVERGHIKEQGKRSDLEEVANAIADGQPLDEVAVKHGATYIKYHAGFRALHAAANKPKMRPAPLVYYLHGDPGCGKSRVAFDLATELGDGAAPFVACDLKECWFDGYNGEPVIIFDDFAGNFEQRKLLNILDFYPVRAPIKGGFVPVNCSKFIFTSNFPPGDIYTGHHHQAWRRRINHIWDEERVRRECELRFPTDHLGGDLHAGEPLRSAPRDPGGICGVTGGKRLRTTSTGTVIID